MTVHLEIPESIANSVRLPAADIEPRLLAELARLSRFAFADLVTTRNIPRHYGDVELAQDLDYPRGQ